MTDSEKALYYCHAHTNLFSQKNCSRCHRGMCHTCIAVDNSVCPACSKIGVQFSLNYKQKRKAMWLLISGVIGLFLFLCYDYYLVESTGFSEGLYKNAVMFFLFGVNFTATQYFLVDTTIIDKTKGVPFLGFKLSIIVLILIFLTGIPILYFIYTVVRQNIGGQSKRF